MPIYSALLHRVLRRFIAVGRMTLTYPDGHTVGYGPGGTPACEVR